MAVPALAWTIVDQRMGLPVIGQLDATPQVSGGTIVRARHDTYGEGEFIYLLSVANTLQGSLVTWGGASSGTPTFQTALCPSTANLAQPVAVAAIADSVGSNWGWYQVGGQAIVQGDTTLAAGAAVYIGAAGKLTSTAAAGKQIMGARSVAALGTPSTGLAVVEINRPTAQGAIT